MLLKLYEFMLAKKIKILPKHVVVIDSGDLDLHSFIRFVSWCKNFNIKEITLCCENDLKLERVEGYKIRKIKNGNVQEYGEGHGVLNIVCGYDGKEELVNALRELAKLVAKGKMEPDEVDEKTIESLLSIRSQPDLIIKVGNELPNFLIWQSVYSELYFADIDWKSFRYVDFLRILREYQRRERRYGR